MIAGLTWNNEEQMTVTERPGVERASWAIQYASRNGKLTPELAANVLANNPEQRDDVLRMLGGLRGIGFVRAVEALSPRPALTRLGVGVGRSQ
jgi:hypothetical protein